jgi:putative transposase
VGDELEAVILRMAQENTGWGYDRIAGASPISAIRFRIRRSENILKRHGIAPAPKPSQNTSWKDFINAHSGLLRYCCRAA